MLERQVAEIIGKLAEGIEQSAPGAMTLALKAMQLRAIINLSLAGTVFASILISLCFAPRRLLKWHEEDRHGDAPLMVAVLYGVTCAAGATVCIAILFDAGTWMTAFDPRLGLANEVIEKFFRR